MPDMYLGDDDGLYGDDEILGEDELLGGDLDDVLGQDMYLGGASPQARALARRIASRNGAVVRRKRGRVAQEQVMPFPATSVNAAASATISATPQRTFRTERFTVGSDIAAFFTIDDLEIGRESMFVSSGPVPAAVFSEVGVGTRLRGYTANLGNTITLTVTNIDGAAHTFRAAIIGLTIV